MPVWPFSSFFKKKESRTPLTSFDVLKATGDELFTRFKGEFSSLTAATKKLFKLGLRPSCNIDEVTDENLSISAMEIRKRRKKYGQAATQLTKTLEELSSRYFTLKDTFSVGVNPGTLGKDLARWYALYKQLWQQLPHDILASSNYVPFLTPVERRVLHVWLQHKPDAVKAVYGHSWTPPPPADSASTSASTSTIGAFDVRSPDSHRASHPDMEARSLLRDTADREDSDAYPADTHRVSVDEHIERVSRGDSDRHREGMEGSSSGVKRSRSLSLRRLVRQSGFGTFQSHLNRPRQSLARSRTLPAVQEDHPYEA